MLDTDVARVLTPKFTEALETFTEPVTLETLVCNELTATRPVTLETLAASVDTPRFTLALETPTGTDNVLTPSRMGAELMPKLTEALLTPTGVVMVLTLTGFLFPSRSISKSTGPTPAVDVALHSFKTTEVPAASAPLWMPN